MFLDVTNSCKFLITYVTLMRTFSYVYKWRSLEIICAHILLITHGALARSFSRVDWWMFPGVCYPHEFYIICLHSWGCCRMWISLCCFRSVKSLNSIHIWYNHSVVLLYESINFSSERSDMWTSYHIVYICGVISLY